MDELKKEYRELERDATERSPQADREPGAVDEVGNVGDEARRDLGNLGDDVRDTGDRTFPEVEPSDKSM
jgi:hypothetical protein